MKLLIGVLMTACLLTAGEANTRPKWRTVLYRSSIIALAAANAIDIGSSWGGREMTPMLRSADGTFGARGTGIKLGVLAGMISTEMWLIRKYPNSDMVSTPLNLAIAASMSRIAVNNLRNRNSQAPSISLPALSF